MTDFDVVLLFHRLPYVACRKLRDVCRDRLAADGALHRVGIPKGAQADIDPAFGTAGDAAEKEKVAQIVESAFRRRSHERVRACRLPRLDQTLSGVEPLDVGGLR